MSRNWTPLPRGLDYSAHLVAHEWDAYGTPTVRDVDAPPLTEFECDHAPKHKTIEPHLAELREELQRYEYDRDRAQEDLDEAEGAVEETQQLIEDAEVILRGTNEPREAGGTRPWLP